MRIHCLCLAFLSVLARDALSQSVDEEPPVSLGGGGSVHGSGNGPFPSDDEDFVEGSALPAEQNYATTPVIHPKHSSTYKSIKASTPYAIEKDKTHESPVTTYTQKPKMVEVTSPRVVTFRPTDGPSSLAAFDSSYMLIVIGIIILIIVAIVIFICVWNRRSTTKNYRPGVRT